MLYGRIIDIYYDGLLSNFHEMEDYVKICFSLAGNRTPAAAVKTPNPSH